MPAENFYCLDNFFKKMTDLDSPKKNNDCYFYYYSTCAKGDNCIFRHEPSALGCETMCSFWKEGKCVNVHCNFRHMELRKNRKAIPCYWESQPIGCLKAHCPFMHRNPRPNEAVNKANIPNDQSVGDINSSSERKVTAVDSFVVNFEEESDNESMPTFSPKKSGEQRIVTVKSLEEIRLEKIQAESAAYYSYNDSFSNYQDLDQANVLRQRIFSRMVNRQPERVVTALPQNKRYSDSQLTSAIEKKRKVFYQNQDGNLEIKLKKHRPRKSHPADSQVSVTVCVTGSETMLTTSQSDISSIKIKTLEEIRAERKPKEESSTSSTRTQEEQEVSSTSMDLDMEPSEKLLPIQRFRKKIILRRKLPQNDRMLSDSDENTSQATSETFLSENNLACTSIVEKDMFETGSTSSKLDESLLLEDDDDDIDEDTVLLKPEEELLNEIDDCFED